MNQDREGPFSGRGPVDDEDAPETEDFALEEGEVLDGDETDEGEEEVDLEDEDDDETLDFEESDVEETLDDDED